MKFHMPRDSKTGHNRGWHNDNRRHQITSYRGFSTKSITFPSKLHSDIIIPKITYNSLPPLTRPEGIDKNKYFKLTFYTMRRNFHKKSPSIPTEYENIADNIHYFYNISDEYNKYLKGIALTIVINIDNPDVVDEILNNDKLMSIIVHFEDSREIFANLIKVYNDDLYNRFDFANKISIDFTKYIRDHTDDIIRGLGGNPDDYPPELRFPILAYILSPLNITFENYRRNEPVFIDTFDVSDFMAIKEYYEQIERAIKDNDPDAIYSIMSNEPEQMKLHTQWAMSVLEGKDNLPDIDPSNPTRNKVLKILLIVLYNKSHLNLSQPQQLAIPPLYPYKDKSSKLPPEYTQTTYFLNIPSCTTSPCLFFKQLLNHIVIRRYMMSSE